MAVKDKSKTQQKAVTRISAHDTSKPIKKNAPTKSPAATSRLASTFRRYRLLRGTMRILSAIGGYFKGSWYELRQVRWPNRRETWGMTGALLGFTAFFVLFIPLIDALFQYLFKVLLG